MGAIKANRICKASETRQNTKPNYKNLQVNDYSSPLSMKETILAAAMLALVCLCLSQAEEFNGTTYKLSLSDMQVTQSIDGSSFNITIHEKTDNISLLTPDGNKTVVNNSYSYWRGDNIYRIDFDKRVTGDLVYTVPHLGQQFILPLRDNRSVRVVLPQGYTTGDRILGIARPNPDQVTIDKNETVLTWINPQGQVIDVGYYKVNAPEVLKRIFALLAIMAVILLLEYYVSIRKLRAISREAEKEV